MIELALNNIPDFGRGHCADLGFPDLFFPDGKEEEADSLPMIQQICGDCPVRVECLRYAIDNDEKHGYWGGASPQERQAIARKERRTNYNGTYIRTLDEVNRLLIAGLTLDQACAEIGIKRQSFTARYAKDTNEITYSRRVRKGWAKK